MDEIDITPLKLAGLTVISTELPNKSSRADRQATESARFPERWSCASPAKW